METKVTTGANMMTQQEILDVIRDYEKTVRDRYQIVRLGIFGSAARGSLTEESDVDVVVELAQPSFMALTGILIDLENLLDRDVDIVRYRKDMNPDLKHEIDAAAIYV